jgi:Holliday junction resolvase-like predicted endonuclease
MELLKKKIGDFGEEIVVTHLKAMKHAILACKYRSLYGEVDIVSCETHKLHFIEVKTVLVTDLSRETYVSAEEHVTCEKLGKLRKTAEIFMDEFGFMGDSG